jgi:SAM-dependent methyltransferase
VSDADCKGDRGGDARRSSPAFPRNIRPIAEALAPLLAGASGRALEIGCGPGEHAVALARAFPALRWTPTDPDPAAVASAAAWAVEAALPNLDPPFVLDAAEPWETVAPGPFALVLAVNVIHIAPWTVAEGLIRGAGLTLAPGGRLALYGPFFEAGRAPERSNVAFDRTLRAQNLAWGVRRLESVSALAAKAGLGGPEVVRLPANNLLVSWRRLGA